MYICVCRAVTENEIREAIENGANSVRALKEQLQVSEACGCCLESVKECLEEAASTQAA